MKYIRTNEGVYEIESFCEPSSNYYWVKQDCDDQPFVSEDIIAKSDSIDKLCDCYAVEDCLNPFSGVPVFIKSFSYAKRKANKAYKLLYGYIIVEKKGAKALEPVAVLNEEGEMELL